MQRSNNIRKLTLILGIVIAVAVVGGAALVVFGQKFSPTGKLVYFPVEDYRRGEQLWNNSLYRISGTLDNILAQSTNNDRYLVSFSPKDNKFQLPVIRACPKRSGFLNA